MAMKSTTQVILDTNLWIYLSQEETPPDVEEALSAAGLPRSQPRPGSSRPTPPMASRCRANAEPSTP